ncbi:unnamed protein product [Bursaphelenchus okinawaensis]|uniref:Protein kinase domain-containing protein n=1 Tax=Bursaphelenchus okinawaensis TaxID=465554 RepID=A0A811LSH7_9BILA|nr:unnamed protein product [Bursaphelenchus okinawaensis]CAG9127443.1 unnamed protein product [Bursaphelenchus okinawaensis]
MAEEPTVPLMKEGDVVQGGLAQYSIVKLLGEGGFGAVYQIKKVGNDEEQYAMKVEHRMKKKDSKLKMEIWVLREVKRKKMRSNHFTLMIDKGKTELSSFLVMELVGKSLEDEMEERSDKGSHSGHFTVSTGLRCAYQMLEGLHQLHMIGFIHRDLKPANYAHGLGKNIRNIYILDFGISRFMLAPDERNDKKKRLRCFAPFKGTVRYASLSCHRYSDQDYKDDIESWFYSFMEIMHPEGLPWKNLNDKLSVMLMKEDCRRDRDWRDMLFPGFECRAVLWKILELIDDLEYSRPVPYRKIYQLLNQAMLTEHVNDKDPLDWENPLNEPRIQPESSSGDIVDPDDTAASSVHNSYRPSKP